MKVWYRFLKCYFRFHLYYRSRFLTELIRDFLMMYSCYALWNALYEQGIGADGLTRVQLLTYGVVGGLVTTFITRDGCQRYIVRRITEGTMDGDLLKPLDLQYHMLLKDLAQKSAKLLQFTVPALLVFSFLAGLYYFPALWQVLLFAGSVFLGYLVLFSINYLFGLLCFVTLTVENIYFCYTAVVCFLAGQLVPLWMFPEWMQRLISGLPFRCIYDIPMSIYIGRVGFEEAVKQMGLQFLWAILLWLLGMVLWKIVRKRIVSQGG